MDGEVTFWLLYLVMAVLLLWGFWKIGYAIGKGKGCGSNCAWLGLFLGPIGWLIGLNMKPSDDVVKCRWCGRPVKEGKKRCACGKRYDDAGASREYVDPVAQWEMQQRVEQGPPAPRADWQRDQPME